MTIKRRCWVEGYHYQPHAWEWLNPHTNEPFRRGRVVFLCQANRP